MKLFAIDIGNTSTSCALFANNAIVVKKIIKKNDLASIINWIKKNDKNGLIVLSSVDPIQTKFLIEKIKNNQIDLHVISHENCGLKMDVEYSSEVGVDRICNSYAAKEIYKGPCVIIDFGTATTYDVVDSNQTFIGGAIAPGIEVSSENLISKAALLNKLNYENPKKAIGKNTIKNLQSGIMFGAVDSIHGMIRRIKNEMIINKKIKIILTGGFCHTISPLINFDHEVNLELTLHGINLIYKNEIKIK
tara:strand:+ start:42 stop:785 length:744 start_codon:yes stop_codon:yes gene_type:complete